MTAPVLDPAEDGWRKRAECRGADWRAFFAPGAGIKADYRLEPTAEDFCRPCPVRAACGAAADARRDSGLWGGSYRWVDGDSRYRRRALIVEAERVCQSTAKRHRAAGEPLCPECRLEERETKRASHERRRRSAGAAA